MTTRIKLRRDTAANWTAENPILAAGEPGLETDTGKVKYGDGVSRWNAIEHTGGDTLTDDKEVKITVGNNEYWAMTNRANNDGNGVESSAVVYDSENNVIMLHINNNAVDEQNQPVISKFNNAGTLLWQKHIQENFDYYQTHDLAVDSGDNIYVALTNNSNINQDLAILKFNSAGTVVWQQQYHPQDGEVDSRVTVGSMAVRGTNIFVSGWYVADLSNTFNRGFIMRASTTDGALSWFRAFDYTQETEVYGMEVGADGNPVVVGRIYGGEGPQDSAFVTKFAAADGAGTWTNSIFDVPTGTEYSGGDVTIDGQNNVYVSLNSQQNIVTDNGENDRPTVSHVVKLNSSGAIQWTRRIGPGPCATVGTGIDCDSLGNVYLSALTTAQPAPIRDSATLFNEFSTGNRNVLAIAKYSTAGAVLWQRYIETDHYYFVNSRDSDPSSGIYSYQNRGRQLSISTNGKIAVQASVYHIDLDNTYDNANYAESITFQIDQDGREMTVGTGSNLFKVKESRIPARMITITSEVYTDPAVTNNTNIANVVTVTNPDFTFFQSAELAQQLTKTAPYEYVFGNDGTLTIPNDGDVRLTQAELGWFSIFGPANNNEDDIYIHGHCVDTANGDVYLYGEMDDNDEGFVARFNSQGQVQWSIKIYDITDERNSKVKAAKLHPTNGHLVLLLEEDDGSDSVAIFEIDTDTAQIVRSAGFRDLSDAGDCTPLDFDFLSDGSLVIVGEKYGEYATQTATPRTGSAAGLLVVNTADVTGTVTNSWRVSGTGITGRTSIQRVNEYINLATTVRQGSGAEFTVEVNGAVINTESVMGNITVASQAFSTFTAYGYSSVTSPTFGSTTASSLAELYYIDETPTPYTRLTLTPGVYDGFTVNANGLIANDPVARTFVVVEGGAQMTPEEVSPGVWVYFNRTGDVFNLALENTQTLAVKVGYSDIPDTPGTYSVLVTAGGSNYLAGHKVKVLGSALGGTTPENDVIITVDAVDAGAITSVSRTGDANIAAVGPYTAVAHANHNVGSGATLTLLVDPTNGAITYGGFNTNGSNYVAGDVITVAGTAFVTGTSPANDASLTITLVDGSGTATGTDGAVTGTAPTGKLALFTTAQVDYSGVGTWLLNQPLDSQGFIARTTPSSTETFALTWTKIVGGAKDNYDDFESVMVDADNNIYVAGQVRAIDNAAGSNLNNRDCAVVAKFNSTGTLVWSKALNDSLDNCWARSIAVRGNTVAVAHYNDDNGDVVITKLTTAGVVQWQRRFDVDDSECSVAIDTNGDIYAVGEAFMESQYERCIKVIRMNSGGEPVWRKILATQADNSDTTGESFEGDGRYITVDDTYVYVSGQTTAFADDYANGFLVKFPKTGDCDGHYDHWTLMTDAYDVTRVYNTNVADITLTTATGQFGTWEPDYESQWYDPSDGNDQYQTLTAIRDRDGGAIEFADGTRQTTSAQMIPQRRVGNGRDIRLSLEDMGKHIYVTDSDTSIAVPYSEEDVPLPIGYTVVIINNSGGTINVDADGGNIDIIVPGVQSATYWELESPGMATLIKVDDSTWFMTGNVFVD
jgi:hypothetical protein